MDFKNRKRNIVLFYIGILVSINLIYGAALKTDEDVFDRINRNFDIFGKVYREVSLNYVDNLDVDKFMRAGIEGMLGTLDPYTVYYDENNRNEIELITSGKYGGIGITIELRDSIVFVSDVLTGYEAEKKGLRHGDKITEIDGISLNGMKLENIRKMVRGQPGSTLKFKVERGSDIINFELTRQEIILKNIPFYGYIGDESDGIAYIKLDRFTNTSENEVENALKTFKTKGNLKGVVFDLRNNGGGLLEAAIGILNKFVTRNSLLLITKGREKNSENKFFSKQDPLIPNEIPLVVLINKNTASASEIVSGAIQDLDRGVIIGSRSFGKGLVQQIRDLSYGSKLKITMQRYFTPSGRWIQEKNYFKENKYGVFSNIEGFNQTNFKTLNGRIVKANGGISPDIEIKPEEESEIYFALYQKDMFFKFANYFLAKNPGINSFSITDDIFNDFKEFIKSEGFDFQSEADKKIEDLKLIADKKNYSNEYYEFLVRLKDDLQREEAKEIDKTSDEIKYAIEREINKRILNEDERVKASLRNDKAIIEAIRIIKTPSEYNSLLNK